MSVTYLTSIKGLSITTFALLTVFQPSITCVISFSYMQCFCVIGIALICTILPLTFELAALEKIQSAEFTMLMMLDPISAAIWGFLIFDDKLNFNQSIGATIIILALALMFCELNNKKW